MQQRYMCYLSWNSTGEIGRIGGHRDETHRYFNIRFFGQMPPDASDFPGGIPALGLHQIEFWLCKEAYIGISSFLPYS